MTQREIEIPKLYMIYTFWIILGTGRDITWHNGFDVYFGKLKHLGIKWIKLLFFLFQKLKLKVSVFQTKDNRMCRQNVHLNPSLVLQFGNYESLSVYTKSVWNFQLVLSWSSLYLEATSRKVKLPLGTVNCTNLHIWMSHSQEITIYIYIYLQKYWPRSTCMEQEDTGQNLLPLVNFLHMKRTILPHDLFHH